MAAIGKKKSKKRQLTEAAVSAIKELVEEGQTDFSDVDLVVYDREADDSDDVEVDAFLPMWRTGHILCAAIKELIKEGYKYTIVRLSEDAFTEAGGLRRAPRDVGEATERIIRGTLPTRGLHVVTGSKEDDLFWMAYTTWEHGRHAGATKAVLDPITKDVDAGALTPLKALELTGSTMRTTVDAQRAIDTALNRDALGAGREAPQLPEDEDVVDAEP